MTDQQILSTSPMKQSVSLTSLPPSTSHGMADVSDSSIAKIIIERPYNSLKVKYTLCSTFFFFVGICDLHIFVIFYAAGKRRRVGQTKKSIRPFQKCVDG